MPPELLRLSLLALTCVACGKGAPPAMPGVPTSVAPAPGPVAEAPPAEPLKPEPAKKEDEIVWDGGTLAGKTVTVTLLQAVGTEGQPKPLDVWVYEAAARRWVRVVKALDYGAIGHFAVPVDFGHGYAYLLAPETKPVDRMEHLKRRVDISVADGVDGPGPYTIIAADDRGLLGFQWYNNAELRKANTVPGKARLQLHTIQVGDLGLGSLELGTVEGTCFDQNLVINEGLLELAPGTLTPALFSADSDTGCKGPKLAAASTLTLADGDIAIAVAIGESAKDLQLRAFVLER